MDLDDGLDIDPLAELRALYPNEPDDVLGEWARLFVLPGGRRPGTVASYNDAARSALIDLDDETAGLLITTAPGMHPAVGDRVMIVLLLPGGPGIGHMLPEGA